MLRILVFLFLLGVILPPSAFAQSDAAPDCRRAKRPADRVICSNPQLRELDRELDELRKALEGANPQLAQLQRVQHRVWRSTMRSSCGQDAGCISKAYQTQIGALRQMAGLPRRGGAAGQPQHQGGRAATQQAPAIQDIIGAIGPPRAMQGLPLPRVGTGEDFVPISGGRAPQSARSSRNGDCRNARTPAEQTVCANPDLAMLDRDMATAFGQVLAGAGAEHNRRNRRHRAGNPSSHEASQRGWRRAVRDACGDDVTCLGKAYVARINWLHQVIELPPRPPWSAGEQAKVAAVSSTQPPANKRSSIQGTWEGSYGCGGERLLVTIEARAAATSGTLEFRYYPARGRAGPDGTRNYKFVFDTLTGAATLTPGPVVGISKQGRPQDVVLTGFISTDGSRLTGRAAIRDRECGTFEFARVSQSTQLAAVAAPLVSRKPKPPPVPALAAEDTITLCVALRAWGEQLLFEHPEIRSRDSFVRFDRTQKSNLFRDDKFVPFIGKRIGDIDNQDYVGLQRLLHTGLITVRGTRFDVCSIVDDPPLRVLDFVREGASHRSEISAIQHALAWKERVIANIERLPDDGAGLQRIEQLETEAEQQLKPLWPSDRREVLDAVERKKAKVAEGHRAELLSATAGSPTIEKVASLHKLRDVVAPERRQEVRARIEELLGQLVGMRLRALPTDEEPLQALLSIAAIQHQVHVEFAAFKDYHAVRFAFGALEGTLKAAQEVARAEFQARLATVNSVEGFEALRSQLQKMQAGQGNKSQHLASLWKEYSAAVDAWIARQAKVTPPTATGKGEEKVPATFDVATPLGVSTAPSGTSAFDPANPLGLDNPSTPAATPRDAGFMAQPWANPEVMKATFTGDFLKLYQNGSRATLLYFSKVSQNVSIACPRAIPSGFGNVVASGVLGADITGDPGAISEALIAEAMKRLQRWPEAFNLHSVLRGAIEEGQLEQSAATDSQLLMQVFFNCPDPGLKRFFDNALSFARDPTAGIPAAHLSMQDLCVRDLVQVGAGQLPRLQAYCTCAEPILNGLPRHKREFIRAEAGNNLGVLRRIDPDLSSALGRCAR